jgi:hypothetical protein
MQNGPWYPPLTLAGSLRWARSVDLPRQAAARLPSMPGVYRFRDAAGRIRRHLASAPGDCGPARVDFARRAAELAALLAS